MSDVVVVRIIGNGPPGVGLPSGAADADKYVVKDGATPYLYKLVPPPAGSGTVTSVSLALPNLFTLVTPTVTTSGTLEAALAVQAANRVFAGPTTGSSAAPTFRSLVSADLPDTAVTPGAYTYASITVDAKGRITLASSNSPSGGGTVMSVSGVAPISVANSTTTPSVSIAPATSAAAGSMSATDKAKLDSITADSATVVRKLVRNNTGSSIPKGSAVYQTGSSGTTLTVALADASLEATAGQTLGITQEAIANNTTGYVVAVGLLDGIDTSTLAEGQIVWLSETAGQLTTTRPTQPAHGVVMGYCVKQSPGTSGILYVKVDNGLELNELHDVLISGAATDQALVRASDGLWKNRTIYSSSMPAALGTAAVGTGTTLARADHVHAMPSAADVGAATSGHVHGNITNAGAIGSTSGLPVKTGTSGVLEAGSFGTTSGTFAQGNDARFHDAVTLAASVTDVLDLSGQVLAADDPGADRILFWDDSEGRLRHLSLGTNLSITGTTLDAAGGGGTKTLQRFAPRDNQPPAANFATIDTRNSVAVLEFDAATQEAVAFVGVIPEGATLTSGLLVRIWWMGDTATSGNVRWGASFERTGTDLDADSFDSVTEVTSAANGTSGIETVAEIACTAIDSLVAGDRYRLRISRIAADATNDTMSGDAQLTAVEVRQVA